MLDFICAARHAYPMTLHSPGLRSEASQNQVAFDKLELNALMSVYGRMVAAGEWRDYGLSFLSDVAVFSIFRHSAENPLYRVEKRPRLRAKQGMYCVLGMDGQILKRGHDLRTVLRFFDRKLIRVVKP